GPLQRQLTDLARSWGAQPLARETLAAGADPWDVALVDLSPAAIQALAASVAPWPEATAARSFGLVPISLSTEARQALRRHFRLLINKPVHHAALFGLLSGASPRAPLRTPAPTHFGLRVLVVEDN